MVFKFYKHNDDFDRELNTSNKIMKKLEVEKLINVLIFGSMAKAF
jgi:hypothetical protein